MIKYVYLASPYTKPLPNHNVHRAIMAADQLTSLGFIVFVPLLSHLWDTVSPHGYEFWMEQDLAWVERCDAVLRLDGESSGADREVEHAKKLGKPVFYDLTEIVIARRETQ